MQNFQTSRVTNQPNFSPKLCQQTSTPVCDPVSSQIKPAVFSHFDQHQPQSMEEDKPNQEPQTTILERIIAQVEGENSQLSVLETLISSVLQLSETVEFLKKEVRHLEYKMERIGLERKEHQSKRKRRRAVELEKNFVCPYETCLKGYASDISLNLHVRLKHKEVETEKQNQRKICLIYPNQPAESKFELSPQLMKGVQSEYSRLLLENQQ